MKKILLVIVSALCVLAFVSCDLAPTLDSISNMIHDYATGIGGPYLKETEYSEPPSSSSESSSDEPTSTSSSSSSEESSSSSESSSEPEPPPPPPQEPLPERNPVTFGQLLGANVTSQLPRKNDTASTIWEHTYNHKVFGAFRVYEDFETGFDVDDEGVIISTGHMQYKAIQTLLLDIQFDLYIEPIEDDDLDQEEIPEGNPENPDPENPDPENPEEEEGSEQEGAEPLSEEQIVAKTYLDVAKALYTYAKEYQNSFSYNLAKFELGRHPEKHYTADEYATLISYAYDTNGIDVDKSGLIAGNKDAKIVMGALAEPDSQYISDMMDALATLRAGERPVFVGAFNTEAFVPNLQTPEGYYLDEDGEFYKMIKLRDEKYNHVEFHVSAFGYDTLHPTSDYYATEQWQANYMVRSYLIFAALGVDSASAYALQDKAGEDYDGFGVLREDGSAKIAQYYLFNTRRLLADYTFKSVVANSQGAMIYEFEKESTGERILAVWNPVSDDSVIDNVQIAVNGEGTLVRLTSFNGYTFGINDTLTPEDGFVKVDATATPQFILLGE